MRLGGRFFSTSKSFQPSIDVILYIVASVTTQFLDAFLESICSRTVVVLSLTFSFMRFCPGNYGNAPNLLLQFCTLQFLKVMQVRLQFSILFSKHRGRYWFLYHLLSFKCEIVNIKWHFTLWDDFFFCSASFSFPGQQQYPVSRFQA